MKRATLLLSRACNNVCVFCAQHLPLPAGEGRGEGQLSGPPSEGAPLIASEVEGRLEHLRSTGATELTFVGGEPTLRDDLPELIKQARARGFQRVGLQTNGRRLAEEPFTAALATAGLTDVHVTLLGGEAAVHDYHTGVEGSFRALVTGLGVARARGVQVVASTVLTRSNYRVLNAIVPVLVSRGVSAWQVTAPLVAGRTVAAMDRVVPRLALAVPYALHALEAAQKQGVRTFVSGVPNCLLGPFAARSLPSDARAFAAQCSDCPARTQCSGVDATYLARFGSDELNPTAQVPVTVDALGRMFTGPGEVFVPSEIKVPAPPSKVREQLPELGKGAPATAEVSMKDRKSGEALKGLFPELFKSKD